MLLTVVSLLLAATAAAPAQVAGDWRLVEQHYNGGGDNFASGAPELRVRFAPAGTDAPGTVSFDGWTAAWPAWLAPAGAAALDAVTVRRADDGSAIEADYRVRPAPGDDTWLVVHESCRATAPETLACAVEVGFERAGVRRGGFTWQRVFARVGRP